MLIDSQSLYKSRICLAHRTPTVIISCSVQDTLLVLVKTYTGIVPKLRLLHFLRDIFLSYPGNFLPQIEYLFCFLLDVLHG
jgi:hypothetical protein